MAITITRPAKPTVTVVRRYDAAERLVHETVDGTTTSYAYDKSSNVTDVFLTTPTMSRAQVLHYEWDARNRVTLIRDVRANREVGLVYDPASQLTKLTYPSGVTKDMTYGLRGETKSITYKTPAGSNIRTLEYEYDDGLQLIERRETASVGASEKTTYGYDLRGQLKSASYPDGTGELFEYDSSGNIVQYVVLGAPGGTTSELRVHDAADQLNIIAGSRQITFTYDPRGNLRTRTENGITTTYTWDSAGRLLGVTGGATLTAEYADDYRLIKVQEGDQAAFTPVWCLDNILVELTPSGAEQNFTLSMLDLDSPLERALPDGTYETLLTDHLMSAISAVDLTGKEVRVTKFGAYGNVRSGASPGPVGYAGARTFDGGRILFLRNRWYSPELGRFVSRDPIGFEGGWNAYGYVGNSPTSLRDPTGQAWWLIGALGMVAIDAAHRAIDPLGNERFHDAMKVGGAGAAAIMMPGLVQNELAKQQQGWTEQNQQAFDATVLALPGLDPVGHASAAVRSAISSELSVTLDQLKLAMRGLRPGTRCSGFAASALDDGFLSRRGLSPDELDYISGVLKRKLVSIGVPETSIKPTVLESTFDLIGVNDVAGTPNPGIGFDLGIFDTTYLGMNKLPLRTRVEAVAAHELIELTARQGGMETELAHDLALQKAPGIDTLIISPRARRLLLYQQRFEQALKERMKR